MGWNDFSLPGCGEVFDNEDGTSRQDELRRCEPGEYIRLVREPENPHDPMAVAIVSQRGVRVGYLRHRDAVWMASKIDRGYQIEAIVERVRMSPFPRCVRSIIVRVSMGPPSAGMSKSTNDQRFPATI